MASRSVRKIGWFVAGDVALILIPIEGHPFLADILGAHGLVFGFVLPLAVYLLVPAVVIWIIVWVVANFRKTD
jgi:hypothetical protein